MLLRMKKLLTILLVLFMPILASAQVVFKINQTLSSTSPYMGVVVGDGVGTSTLRASSTPAVASINATSTVATSTFQGGVDVRGGLQLLWLTGTTNCLQLDTNGNVTPAAAACSHHRRAGHTPSARE